MVLHGPSNPHHLPLVLLLVLAQELPSRHELLVKGLGFRVQGSGFRVPGSGFRVSPWKAFVQKEAVQS